MKGFLLSLLFRTALFKRPSFKRPPLRASLHASLLRAPLLRALPLERSSFEQSPSEQPSFERPPSSVPPSIVRAYNTRFFAKYARIFRKARLRIREQFSLRSMIRASPDSLKKPRNLNDFKTVQHNFPARRTLCRALPDTGNSSRTAAAPAARSSFAKCFQPPEIPASARGVHSIK